ncbi:MAG: DNA topoisomerase VI, partial [bacterium]
MAKKSNTAAASGAAKPASGKVKERDAATQRKILALAEEIVRRSLGGKEPIVQIPTRTKSNTIWNRKKGILEMGDATAERPLFDLKTAKQFMQTMLHASTIKDLIEAQKTSSLRGVFYKAKHTVAGTKENTFDTQDE